MSGAHPALTVVLIAYNDVDNVAAALDSALAQDFTDLEVVAVDDASSDGTGELLDARASRDPRVRVLHLAENSGGCSTPRNAGIEAARGEWVMFLDSDDVLEPHACAALVSAGRRHDADLVCAAMLRADADGSRAQVKFPWLYARASVVDGLRDRPELLTDVMVQDKLFRRALLAEHGIRFPPGVLFEDLDVTVRALTFARRVAVVPDVVYRHVQRDAELRRSITQRTDLRAAVDRIAAQRRADAFLLEHDLPAAKLAKDVRFLQHDLRDHLRELDRADAPTRAEVVALARDYLPELDPHAFRRVRPVQRGFAWLLRRTNPTVVAWAVRARRAGARVSARLIAALPPRVVEVLARPARKA